MQNTVDNSHLLLYYKLAFLQKGVEERVAAIDEKIAKKQAEIDALEARKQKLLHPVNLKTVMAAAKEAGLTPEEIAEKLGLEV